jgi:DNA-binding NarL/FixJ family response regulator
MIRILLVDDHNLVRSGLRTLVERMTGCEIVAEAANGRDACRLAREHAPDLVLLDVSMPELNGIDAARRILADVPQTRVLMLSMHDDEAYVREAVRAGASGYVLKDASDVELERAIHAVMRGETYLGAVAAQRLMTAVARGGAEAKALTPRQREVLQLVAEGHSTRDIAERLHLSGKTVEAHRAALMQRLDIHDVAGLVRYALREGLIRG